MDKTLQRMWINQPSTHQPLHHLHGVNVLAHREYGETFRIYFLTGAVVSMQAFRNSLSKGWNLRHSPHLVEAPAMTDKS